MHHAFLDRLASNGVTGKMWRLIDVLYRKCWARISADGYASRLPSKCIAALLKVAPCLRFCTLFSLMACLMRFKWNVLMLDFIVVPPW